MRPPHHVTLTILITLLAACDDVATPAAGPDGGGPTTEAEPDGGRDPDGEVAPDGGQADDVDHLAGRPYQLMVPSQTSVAPAPLIVLLHGYGASGQKQAAYFGILEVAAERGILVAYPDGTVDGLGRRFWNATDACCNFTGSEIDDVAYLDAVIDDVSRSHAVDPGRVYLVGHSNGGFMAHRMACQRADRIAAIVSLAGATWDDASRCEPSEPVAVLQVHGDADATIRYGGGVLAGHAYPSALTTVERWAALNGCTGNLETTGLRLNLDLLNWGSDTRVERVRGCAGAGADVELWTIEGGRHTPGLKKPAWPEAVIGFLEAHARL
jgi:polyhydroxybutyrate depolymerase